MIHSCKFETCSLSKDSGSSQLRSKDDDKMMNIFILISMNVAIIKVFFTQGKICLHRSNRGGLDYILGDPKAIHRSHTKPDFHDEWDIEIIMLVNWSRSVTQKT